MMKVFKESSYSFFPLKKLSLRHFLQTDKFTPTFSPVDFTRQASSSRSIKYLCSFPFFQTKKKKYENRAKQSGSD